MLLELVYFTTISLICLILIRKYILQRRITKNSIAFFHLYCSSGGGGERVLWSTIETIFTNYPDYRITIYCHKSVPTDTSLVLKKVKETFKIDLRCMASRLELIPLRCSSLIEARRYPFLTLLMQSVGSILLAIEAVIRLTPEVYIESMGFTFTLPVFRLHKCKVITYVHFPIISSDMIHNVRTSSHASFNNREIFVRSSLLRNLKLVYYRLMAGAYGFAGRQADLVMVNSSWTQNHISSLWHTKAHIVYPPCDVDSFKLASVNADRGDSSALKIVSLAQFRPEKRHQLQIEAFDQFLNKSNARDSRLTLYGGCRDESDRGRVRELRELVETLDLGANVDIVVNAPFEQLLEGMRDADVAIHTMENEHFGIVLLEFMAAGLIVVAHNSGGPRIDIIDDGQSGFLADDVASFSQRLVAISRMSLKERQEMRQAAQKKADQFTNQKFADRFVELTRELL